MTIVEQTIIDIIITNALAEDQAAYDITSQILLNPSQTCSFAIIAKEPGIVSGLDVAQMVFAKAGIKTHKLAADGDAIYPGQKLLEGTDGAISVLSHERVALNFIQMMSGIATLTHKYVKEIEGTKAAILDTRKTSPGLRLLQKQAVKHGGGQNHRMNLADRILIKDNHLALAQMDITTAIELAKTRAKGRLVEIECDTLDQLQQALAADPDIIMLDNMAILQIKEAVKMADGQALLEVSGGVNLENVRSIAQTGVNFISIGRLTHSAPALDISLDIL